MWMWVAHSVLACKHVHELEKSSCVSPNHKSLFTLSSAYQNFSTDINLKQT